MTKKMALIGNQIQRNSIGENEYDFGIFILVRTRLLIVVHKTFRF